MIKVMKFGGTSVGEPHRMKQVAQLIQDGDQNIVVLSALSGTTNALVELTQLLYAKNKQAFIKKLELLDKHYQHFIEHLYTDGTYKKRAQELIHAHKQHIAVFNQDMFTAHEERSILAQGELLSTAMFQLYCEEQGIRSALLPALDFMRTNNDGEPDDYFIWVNLDRLLKEQTGIDIWITQGYICRNAFGEIDNLQRGGSDYSASLIGAAIKADEIQIWTDIDGMHNNDPRVVSKTRPIHELSFNEAAELAYFGAKILHPSSVRPAQEKQIPVRLKNTLDPDAEGTLISDKSNADQIKAIAAKDGITAIKIRSGRMLMAYGFLRSVFEVFEWYKTPIDMITTSEVAVSLTIDDTTHLQAIVTDLEKYGKVEVDHNLSIVCIVGDFITSQSGFAAQIMQALQEVPLRMVSYGGSKNNVSVLIRESDKQKALVALNEQLFEWE